MENKYQITEGFLMERPLSYSSLKEFRKSPRHYIKHLTDPYEPSEAMIFGKVVDCLTLEPEKFEARFLLYEKFERRSNEAKAKWQDMCREATEKKLTLVTQTDYGRARICVQAIMDNDLSRALIEGKKRAQVRLKWTDKSTALPVIGCVDFESEAWGEKFIVDLKTTNSADPDDFIRQAGSLDYLMQAGTYLEGYPRCFFSFPMFIFLAVETEEPFNVSVMFCDGKYIDTARDEFKGTLNAFRYCLDNQLFHQGYEFRLMGTMNYHLMQTPKYLKPKFQTA